MKNFYMTLLSNSSMSYYPTNTTSSFTVQLPRYMSLGGPWEVALTEIHYPYTFSNVEMGQNEIEIETMDIDQAFMEWFAKDEKTRPPFESTWSTHKITPGFYSDVKDIFDAVNEVVAKETRQETLFNYDPRAHRAWIANDFITDDRKWVEACKLSHRLGIQLGFLPNESITGGHGQYAQHIANMGMIIPDKMLIYCDILEPQLFGDGWCKVLRLINTNAGIERPYFGQACHVTFNPPQYISLQQKHFESVTIDIKDIEGKPMPFQYGTLSVKLHFRKALHY